MEILQTAISALVVATVGFVLARFGSQRFEALESALVHVEERLDDRIDGLDAKFEARFELLDARFEARFERLDARIDALDKKLDAKVDSLRADITQIALAVGAGRARGTA